jgi:hypothetical protein
MLVARYVVALYYLSYSHLPFYKASAVFDWCWNKCESHGLLTHAEVARLKSIPSKCEREGKSTRYLEVAMSPYRIVCKGCVGGPGASLDPELRFFKRAFLGLGGAIERVLKYTRRCDCSLF